jgi:hypothetical protein
MNAVPGEPPADSHRASRPEQDKVPPPGTGTAAPDAALAVAGAEDHLGNSPGNSPGNGSGLGEHPLTCSFGS